MVFWVNPSSPSLISTVTRRPTSSTGLPRPSDSALVGRHPAIASGLHYSSCASSLCPTGFVGLLPPSSSASALCRSGSAADLRFSVSASGSTCSAAIGRPPGVVSPSSTMAPPSIGSAVGYHYGCGLGLAWLLLLRVSSVSSLRLIHPGPFCLLPGSSLRLIHPGLCLLSFSRESVLRQSLLLH
ncbi:Epiplakin [Labeo rohita]|uniref:Epiplakin n=1 Tax=Labeo rohita TaxID=84645 RepID=A0ABQ8LHJ3_LABRO|nr:Epiplakin [Labeo rohita]